MKLKSATNIVRWVIVLGLLWVIVPSAAYSQNTATVDPDWPCIQAYVPEVAIAVIWPEPVEDSITDAWKKDTELKKVVLDFGGLEVFNDADRLRLEQFAESVAEDDRIDVYNKVASGIVHQFNARRMDYFRGIRKYTRQQIAVSKQIESHLNELADLADKTDADSMKRKEEINNTSAWQQRIFDKRERSIGLLCETPVELESLLGDILRELAQFLP